VGLIAGPLFGAIADRYKMKKKLFLLFNLLSLFVMMSFVVLPQSKPSRPVSIKLCSLHNSSSYIVQHGIELNGSKDCRQDESDVISSGEEQGAAAAQATCFASCELDKTEKLSFCNEFPALCSDSVMRETNDNDTFHLEMNALIAFKEVLARGSDLYFNILELHVQSENSFDLEVDCSATEAEEYFYDSCEIECKENPKLNLRFEKLTVAVGSIWSSGVFWGYGCLIISSWIVFSVVGTFADALTLQSLGEEHG
jgi:hypothetical protein